MVNKTKAKSTLGHEGESVEELTSKCESIAKAWAVVAEELMREKIVSNQISTKKTTEL